VLLIGGLNNFPMMADTENEGIRVMASTPLTFKPVNQNIPKAATTITGTFGPSSPGTVISIVIAIPVKS
jgi:hypothetical protein